MNRPSTLFSLLYLAASLLAAQNPVLPGYFADPSAKVFDDKMHIYATTDGYEEAGVGSDPLV